MAGRGSRFADTGIYTVNFGQDASMAGQRNLAGYDAPYTDSEGNGSFFYEQPDGFLAVCTKNLPEPSIKPKEYFNTFLFDDGEGAKTGIGFQPDFLWFKARDAASNSHQLYDAVRGVQKNLL